MNGTSPTLRCRIPTVIHPIRHPTVPSWAGQTSHCSKLEEHDRYSTFFLGSENATLLSPSGTDAGALTPGGLLRGGRTTAAAFIHSKLTPLFIVASVALGALAVVALPREEEPQIIVPMVDVFGEMPGATPADVEQRVTRPMKQLLWEVPGVEDVYSSSSAGQSMVVVRFKVGEPKRRPSSGSIRSSRPTPIASRPASSVRS